VAHLMMRLVGPDLCLAIVRDSDWRAEDSVDDEIADFTQRIRFGGEGKGSFFLDLAGGADEGAHGGSASGLILRLMRRTPKAASSETLRCGAPLSACQGVDWLFDRGADGLDVFRAGEAGGVEDFGSGLSRRPAGGGWCRRGRVLPWR